MARVASSTLREDRHISRGLSGLASQRRASHPRIAVRQIAVQSLAGERQLLQPVRIQRASAREASTTSSFSSGCSAGAPASPAMPSLLSRSRPTHRSSIPQLQLATLPQPDDISRLLPPPSIESTSFEATADAETL